MPKKCLFCQNPVDSAEDVWSTWILQDLKPSLPVHRKIGKTFAKWVDSPEVRIKCVCKKCNNGWMSDIEGENKPHMLAMMNDKPTVLEPAQQKLLTRWAILKAMVLDGASPARRKPFYSESERRSMKPSLRSLPAGTHTWIGRLSAKSFHAGLQDSFGKIGSIPNAFHGCVTTIIVGHLVIQVMTLRVLAMFGGMSLNVGCKPGAWDVNLLEIWPVFGNKSWPPSLSFTADRTANGIGHLVNRYRIGEDITK